MSLINRAKVLGFATIVTAIATTSLTASADGYNRTLTYEVTVTNATKMVQFTPLLAASHSTAIAFFELGQPAIGPLADVAESGSIDALREVLDGSEAVLGVAATEGLLDAGNSVTFTIEADLRNRRFSMAGMLLPTNDSFVALDSVWLPYRGTATYHAKAYDAGSEPNDEICANIPGPFCAGEGRSLDDSNAEGFVHIANGIHGISGDIPQDKYTWDGPVAEVTITRIR